MGEERGGDGPADEQAEQRVGRGCGIGCLGVLALFLAFVVWAYATDDGSSDGDSPELQQIGAENACEDWVRDQLKAPATAKFSGTTSTGSGPWTVTGSVDAENSFGANLRNTWTCEVRLDGDTFRGRAVLDGG